MVEPAIVDAWLQSKGCTQWMNWDVTDDRERAEAVNWFVDQMDMLIDFANFVEVDA